MRLIKLIDAASAVAGSDYALAKLMKVNDGTVSEWRNLKRACPIHQQIKMARIAGVDEKHHAWAAAVERLGETVSSYGWGFVAATLVCGSIGSVRPVPASGVTDRDNV